MTRRLSFPKFELTRLPAPEHTVMPEDAKYKGVTEYLRERFEEDLKKSQESLPHKIFTHYNEADCAYAMQIYAGWNELQRNLALLMMKPKAIERIYADYQHLMALNVADTELVTTVKTVKIETTDFIFDSFNNSLGYLSTEILNQLPYAIRLPIWELLTTGLISFSSEYGMYSFRDGVHDLLLDYPKQGFDIAIKLLPLMNEHPEALRKVVFLTEYLNSRRCVPYVIMGMNSVKTKRHINPQVFLVHFPETFYNELVYILFTTPVDEWHKKVQVNAKKLLQYMIDNKAHRLDYLTQLRAASRRYNAHDNDTNNSTPLTDFLNQYIHNHQQITQEKQALKEAESTITMVTATDIDTNSHGIPQPLLNTDWQKQTRKRKFELDETIWNREVEQTASKQIPILEALTSPIIASTKQPLTIDVFEQLLLMLKLSVEDKPIPALAEVLPAFTSESLAQLSDELWNDYIGNRVSGGYYARFPKYDQRLYGIFNTQNKWFMTASSWMADETLADDVWRFMKDYESEPHVRSSILHSFKVLSALASTYPDSKRGDTALKMLIKISNKSRSTLRPHAQSALEGYAKRLNLSLEDLAERLLPDFDLGERGTKIMDYNPSVADSRKLTISLTPELTFTYQDETGKSYKNPPKACATDDSEAVETFLNQHKSEKKELRGINTDLPKSLEKMMINQRTVSLAEFMTYYVHHPVMTVLAQRLVWRIQIAGEENANNQQIFRVSESLELLNSEDAALDDKYLNNAQVSLVHPIHLAESDIQNWAEVFSDYELIQPFSQLSRPLYYLTDEDKSSGMVHRFDKVRWAMGSLIGLRNSSKGWEVFSAGGGRCDGFNKTVNGYSLSITLYDSFRLGEPVPADDKGYPIDEIRFPKDIDELTASELLRDINEMARVS